MIPQLFRYPLDLTGHSQNNLVLGEPHTVPRQTRRAIAPLNGCFYAASMVVVDTATQQQLTRGKDYSLLELNQEASLESGQEVMQIVLLTEAAVSDTVIFNYQAVGGKYITQIAAVEHLMESSANDNRDVYWNNVEDRPSSFAPVKHLHDIGDIYDFNRLTHLTDRIRQALELSDTVDHDGLYLIIDQLVADLAAEAGQLTAQINLHLNDHENPHQTTAFQIGAYTKTQVLQQLNFIVNTLTTKITNAENALSTHLATFNPHQDSAAKVSSMTSAEVDAEIAAAKAAHPGATDGNWESLFNGNATSFTHINNTDRTMYYSCTSSVANWGTAANSIYVNGSLIAPIYLNGAGQAGIQGLVPVPAGGTVKFDSSGGGNSIPGPTNRYDNNNYWNSFHYSPGDDTPDDTSTAIWDGNTVGYDGRNSEVTDFGPYSRGDLRSELGLGGGYSRNYSINGPGVTAGGPCRLNVWCFRPKM